MKVIKHVKKDSISLVSHIDTMRVLQRTLVRGNINVKFSEGYNPHPITYTSHPLPLGVLSTCEYFVLANDDMTTDEVLERFNDSVPAGMKADYCADVEKNPNLCAKVNLCEYFAPTTSAIKYKSELEEYANLDTYEITFEFKGNMKTQDIAPLIDAVLVTEDGMYFTIATGNPNLRPDRLTTDMMTKYPLEIGSNEIKRVNQFIKNDDGIMTVNEYISSIAR